MPPEQNCRVILIPCQTKKLFTDRKHCCPASPHQLALSDVLAVLEFMGGKPREITLIGIEPECLDTQLELSDTVKASMPLMLQMVIYELQRLGVEVNSVKEMNNPTNSATKPKGYDATHRRIFE